MVSIGLDVAGLAIVGLLCLLLITIFCMTAGMTEEQGNAAVVSSSITIIVMLIGYVIVARVLDMLVLYV